ncbi:Kynurenine formamidase [Pelagirhabdus alkalitolerans]|uniref:Kynurenine formamidase n=1 Tax=Pelagirhabdus alkalitolerans TaxID=1612202 RepID=A0A1G6GPT3_9BACI|nr:cyclase family protein [Pelagirhabdus alkalitolerans]SDB83951.1 Kynurenine formamidase [Pelagirhabdus alkalitolerans]
MSDVLTALQKLKEKRWVDLTHTFGPASPHFAALENAEVSTAFDHSDGFFVQNFSFPGQYGTHIDAPIHFVPKQRYLDELALKELALPLVVIDKSEAVKKNSDFTLQVEDILEFEKEYGEIDPDTFVALRTDWSKRWPDQDAIENKDEFGSSHTPGWSVEALTFLFDKRKIKAIGHETFDTDAAKDIQKNGRLVAEYYVLEQDTFQVELLTNLDQVPPKGSIIFTVAPKFENASGFPVRAFAILP